MSHRSRYAPRFFSIALLIIACAMVSNACSVFRQDEALSPPKILVIWSGVDYSHDPLSATNSEQFFLSSLENRTLFKLSKDGELENDLASGYEVSKDGKKITVTLANNVFSDNSPITAVDVKATLSRLMSLGGEYTRLLDIVKGSGESKNGSDFFGIDAPTNSEVVFELIEPNPFFVYRLAHPSTGILPASTIGLKGELTSNVHSGPFLADVISNELNATTAFRPLNPELPIINVVRKSTEDIVGKPKTEEVDMVLGISSSSKEYKNISIPQLAVASWNIYVKNSDSPFSNVDFRKAVLMVLDGKESVEAFSTRAIKPTGFTASTFDSLDCDLSCGSNVKDSKKIVEKIYPDGKVPEISIHIENNTIQQDLAKSAVARLSEIGIKANVIALGTNELSNEIARGNVQLFRFGWVSDVAVGATPVVNAFKADSSENVSGVTDTQLEKEINQYLQATTIDAKKKASEDMQERVKELWLTRPVAHFHKIVTVKSEMDGFSFDCYGRTDISKVGLRD